MIRKIVLFLFTSILLLSCVVIGVQFVKPVTAATTWTVDDDGPADFSSIQEAITAASDGDTILVASGVYSSGEYLVIMKSVTLLGENPNTTIIEGIMRMGADNIRISGFTVGANPPYWGGLIWHGGPLKAACNNGILNNNILLGTGYDEVTSGPPAYPVSIVGSGWFVFGNRIDLLKRQYEVGYWTGLRVIGANNTIFCNAIGNESYPNAYHCVEVRGNNNAFYHNNIYGDDCSIGDGTTWDDGYPSGGNYWNWYGYYFEEYAVDEYHGPNQDIPGSDGIGDVPYGWYDPTTEPPPPPLTTFVDYYPLMNPWTPIETNVKVKGRDYPLTIVSNTTIEQIVATSNTLHFKSSGPTGEVGYTLVIFPRVNTTEIKVFVDGQKLTPPPFPVINSNGTHYFIYFEFTLSTHTITLQFAPEVPVGGIWTPINKFELLAPYIGLASLIAVATISIVYVMYRKKKQT